MPVGDLARLCFHTIIDSQVQECSFGFRSITEDELWRENVVDEFYENVIPTWLLAVSAFMEVLEVRIDDIVPGTAESFTATPLAPMNGAWNGFTAPLNVAGVITWLTGLAGRSFRGRSYVCGMPLDGTEQLRFVNFDTREKLSALAGDFLSWFGTGGGSSQGEFVIISRFENGAERSVPIATPVIDFRVNQGFGSQRRRLTS